MAHIMSVEKSKFINENIKIFTQNKVGQYSKFLEKNPIFVTYYHINTAMTRTDVGTGGIESEIGPRSPVRFNKILEFPLYNFPELRPDIVFDESGYDIELDLSDIALLPNTIKPVPGDYLLLSFPGIKRYLFRVNSIGYNTIQSNDFYTIALDIKHIGRDIDDEQIEYQVVETYTTVFENIGTQDKCFIKNTDIDTVNAIVDLFYTMRQYYTDEFYDERINSFIYDTGRYTECGEHITLYDPYLEAFINKSRIFFDENSENALVLTPNDILDTKFNSVFNKSVYNAVLDHSVLQLARFQYCYDSAVQKSTSVFHLYGYTAFSVKLFNSKIDIRKYPNYNENEPLWEDILPIPGWKDTWTASRLNEYFSIDFIERLKDGIQPPDDYFQEIIYNYMYDIAFPISRSRFYEEAEADTLRCYRYLPIVLYIITQLYNAYFHDGKALDLP